ncbi:MAG TPA: helix-turn-helix domain-containing protein [Candidatus Hypogeohydataceae bacterium YC41]
MDKQAIGNRLKAVILSQGITQKEFAERVGFSDKYLSDIVRGRTKPSLALLLRIQSVFNVSMQWLVSGVSAYPNETNRPSESVMKEPPAIYCHSGITPRIEKDTHVAIPVLSEAEVLNICNKKDYKNTIKTEESCWFYKDWLSQPDETFCVLVRGTEMEPLLKEGSIVALNIGIKDPTILIGKICGIRVEGTEICFRWLKAVEPLLVFVPQREGYPILCFPIEKNPIIGKVEAAWVRF